MIFLTVGSELPFDRLVMATDVWCAAHPEHHVFGQINEPGSKGYRPSHFEWCTFLTPDDYKKRFDDAEMIISHAGMGSIIGALSIVKQILIMPRMAKYREHRNDHQVATAEKFQSRVGVFLAHDETDLPIVLDKAIAESTNGAAGQAVGQFADPMLINTLREFIIGNKKTPEPFFEAEELSP